MSDAPKLKPCPFCGGVPYLANVAMPGCSYVVCTDCRMQSDDGSKDRVVKNWNTRNDTAVSKARVDALREAANKVGKLMVKYAAEKGGTKTGMGRTAHFYGRKSKDAILALIEKEPKP